VIVAQATVIWNDGTQQTFQGNDADVDVLASGLIVAKRGSQIIYVSPNAYKRVTMDLRA
jgi:hypothetical protein